MMQLRSLHGCYCGRCSEPKGSGRNRREAERQFCAYEATQAAFMGAGRPGGRASAFQGSAARTHLAAAAIRIACPQSCGGVTLMTLP